MRYLLFVFPAFDACGGWNDYAGAFEDTQQAQDEASRLGLSGERITECAHIVDMENGRIVMEATRDLSKSSRQEDGPLNWKSIEGEGT